MNFSTETSHKPTRQELLAPCDSPVCHMLKPASFYKMTWPESGRWDCSFVNPNSVHLSPELTTQDFQEQDFCAGQLDPEAANILWAAPPLGKLEYSPLHSWLTGKPLFPPGSPSVCWFMALGPSVKSGEPLSEDCAVHFHATWYLRVFTEDITSCVANPSSSLHLRMLQS